MNDPRVLHWRAVRTADGVNLYEMFCNSLITGDDPPGRLSGVEPDTYEWVLLSDHPA